VARAARSAGSAVMKVYLGAHQPAWLARDLGVPLLSHIGGSPGAAHTRGRAGRGRWTPAGSPNCPCTGAGASTPARTRARCAGTPPRSGNWTSPPRWTG
jgi:hypothetical protein